MNQLLRFDTLDDRREIWHLLHKLKPDDRVKFVELCCSLVQGKLKGVVFERQKVKHLIDNSSRCDISDRGLTNVIYSDILMLSCQWELDLENAIIELEKCVKKPSYLHHRSRSALVYQG